MSDTKIPAYFARLLEMGLAAQGDIFPTQDGFFALNKSLSDILAQRQIHTFPGEHDQTLQCRYFFDDWYLYAVTGSTGWVYSLFKMREQEFDAALGREADGDTPGITVSFITFQTQILDDCLLDPTEENRKKLGQEINRVVSYRKQTHDGALKAYFHRPEAEGAYLIGQLYTRFIASLAVDGVLDVPLAYAQQCRSRRNSRSAARLPDFIDSNNQAAGRIICDHEKLYFQDPNHLTQFEQFAILATHTANTSFHSLAAEVRFHAMFLFAGAKIQIPLLGCPYASAIRADMLIDDKEFEGPAPYHNPNSRMVRRQEKYHKS